MAQLTWILTKGLRFAKSFIVNYVASDKVTDQMKSFEELIKMMSSTLMRKHVMIPSLTNKNND